MSGDIIGVRTRSKVTGKGLFEVIRDHYPRWVVRTSLIVPVTAAAILALQVFGSYVLIRKIFRWLAVVLFAYAAAAFLAKPHWPSVLRGSLIPTLRMDREYLSWLVAVIGTTLSAYLYTWQSNEEVEEEIEMGRRELHQRQGATRHELRQSRWDIAFGMLFSNLGAAYDCCQVFGWKHGVHARPSEAKSFYFLIAL
jgi:Mn2+/Fe2+ NRAMP family transporter